MEIYDDDGRCVSATFHAQVDGEPWVRFDSSGGSEPNRTNREYNLGLQLVLQRLGLGGATLLDITVESDRVALLEQEQRQVIIDEAAYPIDLARWPDFAQLQRGIGRGAARVGRDPESKSEGNRQKQIRLHLRFPAPTPVTECWLNALISQAPVQIVDEVVTSTERAGASATTRVSYARASSSGQGRSMNVLRNRAVELHAMEVARIHFANDAGGTWSIADVSSANAGYDLRCTRGDEELRVEVKGTVGAGESVILTRNEVSQAHADPERSVLFVVYSVDAEEREGEWTCCGGHTRILRNWDPKARGQLQVEQYKYLLPPWSDEE